MSANESKGNIYYIYEVKSIYSWSKGFYVNSADNLEQARSKLFDVAVLKEHRKKNHLFNWMANKIRGVDSESNHSWRKAIRTIKKAGKEINDMIEASKYSM